MEACLHNLALSHGGLKIWNFLPSTAVAAPPPSFTASYVMHCNKVHPSPSYGTAFKTGKAKDKSAASEKTAVHID